VVPLAFACRAPGVQRLLLCIDRNPFLLSAIFEPGEGVEPALSTRVKMQETSEVRVLAVLRDGRVLSASKEVRITLGGCAGAADSVPERLGQPTLIRLQPTGDGVTVRALLKHEMESGQRKDEAGRIVPAWYIDDVAVRLNDRPVLTAQWGTSISKNPFLQFALKGAKPGDRIAIAWADNRGNRRSDEATLAAAPA
jgi:thiosulfate oxidation carrier complex protein SoxZ